MDDLVGVVEVCQALENAQSHHADDVDIYGAYLLVDAIKGSLVHVLHTYADIGRCEKGAVGRDDVGAVAL
jgi:uncharacterized protein YjaG (DUF416 family)